MCSDENQPRGNKKYRLASRWEVQEEHMAHVEKELSDILTYVAELNALELDGVEPMAHAVPLQNVFREDETKPSLNHDLALSNAPEAEDGYFKVPRVVQE